VRLPHRDELPAELVIDSLASRLTLRDRRSASAGRASPPIWSATRVARVPVVAAPNGWSAWRRPTCANARTCRI